MRVAKYIHSCLLLEKGSSKILFDPGKFSFVEGIVKPEEFTNLAAVIITHAHPDHLQVEAVGQILKNNPGAVVFTNEEVRSELKKQNIEVTVFESGSRIIGEFHVKALSAPHAAILDSDPPQNTAYVIDDTLLNPGDSFADSLLEYKNIPVLALPVGAPWSNELEVAAFAERMAPQAVIPIHDGHAKDFFIRQRYDNWEKHFSAKDVKFHALAEPRATVTV